jgi:signal transduction histidine kinase/DNA-binding response OmpR family regulator
MNHLAVAWLIATAAVIVWAVMQAASARRWRKQAERARREAASLSELRNRIGELERARLRAEESNEAKNEYLATVSHEIRTPLSGIIGMTQIALDSELTPEQRGCMESVQSSAQSLLRVINDILDFSKIEARKLDLQAVHFDLHDRLNEVAKAFGVAAHRKGLELALHIMPGVPRNVVGDDGRLRQVMTNLIGNAVKFTESGQIVVRVTLEGRSKQDVLIHTSITDSGPGIPEGRQEAIFEAYQQADESIPLRFGGTGLGLSIASRLVELMGGRIWAENNRDGAGSTFHFTMRLWLQRLATSERRPILPASGARPAVLIVDDHSATREILRSMLANWELEVRTASSGPEALRQMQSSATDGRGFAFVLVDAQIDGDGFHLAEAIRSDPALPGSVVMLLPSPGDFEGATRCRQMELSAYVTKPVSESELAEAITRALHSPVPVRRNAPPAASLRSEHPTRLLVVDDDRVNREFAVAYLRRWGHTATTADNGGAALAAVDAGEVDALLTDVQMPGMSGIELAKHLRAREGNGGQRIPIIGTSARAGREDREISLGAGMDDYLTKPLDPAELFAAVERIAVQVGSPQARLAAQEADSAADEILRRVDGNHDLARRITAVFLNDTPSLLDELRDAVESGNWNEAAALAHRLKGSAANFPLEEVVACAARLEIASRRADASSAVATFERLEDEVEDGLLALQLVLSRLQRESRASS